MRSGRVRSGAIWAGAALSGLGHAALIGLALVAPPWLAPHPERPVPVVAVAFVSPSAFDAAVAALSAPPRPTAEPTVAAAAAPTIPRVLPSPPPSAEPDAQPADPDLPTLAPAFDPESPLGLNRGATPPPGMPALRPSPRPVVVVAEAATLSEAAAAFEAAVREAVLVAQVYPDAARVRGLSGTVRLTLLITRDGRLLAARLGASSGSTTLDRAALDAARTALLPRMPEALPNAHTSVVVDLAFAPDGG